MVNLAKSARNQEIQTLLLSMKVPTAGSQYISSISRGALWAPNSWLVEISRIAELCFRKHTKTGKPILLGADKVVEDVQVSPLAKTLGLKACGITFLTFAMWQYQKSISPCV